MAESERVQINQPPGVPPLALDGRRTLPDVPADNYWFQRHLVVYEWIRARVGGQRVLDMGCGEGYGADVLARTARSVVGVEADAEAHEHARLRYSAPNLRFEHARLEDFTEPCDAIACLQTIGQLEDPQAALAHFASLVADGGVLYVSAPNALSLRPDGERSDDRWHVHEYQPEQLESLLSQHFSHVETLGVFHAKKLAAHEFALEKLRWDDVHSKLGITKQFYERFLPALTVEDFVLHRLDSSFLGKALDVVAVCRY